MPRFRLSTRPVTIFACFLVIAVITLILVWLLNFWKGVAFESSTIEKMFNMHPLLMVIGFVLVAGEERETQEIFQLILHGVALVAGIIGVYAVFTYHNELSNPNMNTLHSWIGMATFCILGLQFLLGLFPFMFPGANSGARSRITSWRMLISMIIFPMAIISTETGLAERFTVTGLSSHQKARVMNFTVLLSALSGVTVGLRTRSRMEQVFISIVIFLSAIISTEKVACVYLTLQRRLELRR